jgi:hypothetical protein
VKPLPRYFWIVFALPGDSTMTKPFDNGTSIFLEYGFEASTNRERGTSYGEKAVGHWLLALSSKPRQPPHFLSFPLAPTASSLRAPSANSAVCIPLSSRIPNLSTVADDRRVQLLTPSQSERIFPFLRQTCGHILLQDWLQSKRKIVESDWSNQIFHPSEMTSLLCRSQG